MSIFDKVKSLVSKNPSKVAEGVDKATDVIDDKTEGKFHDHLEKVDEKVEELIDKADGDDA
jgi:uncharacterized protein YjbJ (UPF0337 family)